MLDLGEIPTALRVLDALAKEAPIAVLRAGTIQDGRFLIACGGAVEPVNFAHARAVAVAAGSLVDEVLLRVEATAAKENEEREALAAGMPIDEVYRKFGVL